MADFQNKHTPLPSRPQDRRSRSSFTWKRLLLFVVFLIVLLAIIGVTVIMILGKEVDLNKLQNISSSSILLDQDEKEVTKLGDYQRENVNIEQVEKVNPMLVKAFVKVEDVRFYQHHGVDFKALIRALWANIKAGKKVQGGGTITMQVARNVVIENKDKTYLRKLKEIATAWRIERSYNKKQILQAYLNYIYLGNNASGIQMASKLYFGKDVTKDHLEIHEVALLAGLPKAPSQYNPFGSSEQQAAAKKRRAIVLNIMAQSNEMAPLITKQQEEIAKEQPLPDRKNLEIYGTIDKYAAYKNLVLNELSNRYGISEEELSAQTFKIYTGLNTQLQDATDQILSSDEYFQGLSQLDAGTATINVKAGSIAAIGGGRHYKTGFMLRGANEYQQPGSAIKPLTVYTPAIDKTNGKVNEYYIVPDGEMNINGWTPQNYDRQYYGNQPLSFVVEHSLNAATVWLLKKIVGLDDSFNYGMKLGLELKRVDKNYAPLALGGLTKGVTPLQLARAYTALANNGTKIHAYAIQKVVDQNGNETTPVSNQTVPNEQIYSPKAVYYITRILQSVLDKDEATGHRARLADGRPAAGKTGTITNYRTAWFAGYTPDYVTTVMVYNTSTNPKDLVSDLTGGAYPATIFKAIMDQGLAGTPVSDFHKPEGVADPVPPFQLEAPQVTAAYDQAANKVLLSWQQQDPRVTYRVYRSEDGTSWGNPIAEVPSGGTGYEDTTIQPLQMAEPSKTYFYLVVAIDSRATDPSLGSKSSQVQHVNIVPTHAPPAKNPFRSIWGW